MVPARDSATRGPLSPFQAFMTALGASIGTGNIAGVATAVVTGGPGAVFWIWAYGFFATAIKFTEAVLGIQFRVVGGQGLSAGPMHYLRDGLKIAAAGLALRAGRGHRGPHHDALHPAQLHRGGAGRASSASRTWVSGLVIAVLAWLVIIGGIKSIGRAAEKLAPLKVGLYLVGGLVVIVTHAGELPVRLRPHLPRGLLHAGRLVGGTAGVGMMVAMRYGVARGIYANEAGYGTAAVAYGTARSREPLQQGLNAVMEVFIVSFVTSTISALTILRERGLALRPDEHGGGGPGLRHARSPWAAGSSPSAPSSSATRR